MQDVQSPLRRINDMTLLLPSFRERVEILVDRLSHRGLDPVVWETFRTQERAELLAKYGTSKNGALSMHCYGAAADILSRRYKWSNPSFFRALGQEADRLGLTWGGDWDGDPSTKHSFVDSPHVQAIPVRQQNGLRAMPLELRDRFVAARLPPLPVAP